MQIVVNGLLSAYERKGKGKTVILLHGWGDSHVTFNQLATSLAANYDVVVPDLPGFGASADPPATWGLNDYANFVNELVAKLGIKSVYAIIGHSNGGAIAIRGIGKGLLESEKLVLLASSGIRDTYEGRKKAMRMAAKTGKLLTAPFPKNTRDKLRRKAYGVIGSDLFVAENLQDTFKKVVTDDIQADANKINIPTLLVYGSQDKATPIAFGELLASLIDDSTLEIVHSGHFVHLDQAHTTNKLISEFLK